MRRLTVKFIAYGLTVAASSAFAAHKITKARCLASMEETIASEIERFKEDYAKRQFGKVVKPKPDIEVVANNVDVRSAERIIVEKGYSSDIKDTSSPEYEREARETLARLNAIQELGLTVEEDPEDDEWPGNPEDDEDDEDDEFEDISDERPIIITFDEWSESPEGYEQEALVYYEGDETMADEHGRALFDWVENVGSDAVDNFGNGSRDANVVYIRNPKTMIDYEIMRNSGTYAEEVHGIRDRRGSLRRMREDD